MASKSNLLEKSSQQKEYLEIVLQLSDDLPWQGRWWSAMNPEYCNKDWIVTIYQSLIDCQVPDMWTLIQRIGDKPAASTIVRMNLIDTILYVTRCERSYHGIANPTLKPEDFRGLLDETRPFMNASDDSKFGQVVQKITEWVEKDEAYLSQAGKVSDTLAKRRKTLFREAFLAKLPKEILNDYSLDHQNTERAALVDRGLELREAGDIAHLRQDRITAKINSDLLKCSVDLLSQRQNTIDLGNELSRMMSM